MVPTDWGAQHISTMSTNAAKAQQEYLVDPKNRYWPSWWTLLVVLVLLVGAALWSLLR